MLYATVFDMLQAQAEQRPQAIALQAPQRPPLSYGQLFNHLAEIITQLNHFGIGRNDRVAIVLPNGPEMVTAFLGVAAAATCAPLNPNYRAPEFNFYLSDLAAKALLILKDMASPAREVAQTLKISVIELSPLLTKGAGLFTLTGAAQPLTTEGGSSQPDDEALVLHTSGTTSRPKIVPLSQTNICISAHNISQTLQLTPTDRCLNVMPLFHIHGLMAATLASLRAGASLVSTPGFAADKFFPWLAEFQPTWYTAVPTMHHAILARAEANREVIRRNPLRLLRSSSSSLPPQVMVALEDIFSAPMIEAYGMTEAAHQMTSNPLPPGRRKAGSVGLAAGPQVRIMAEEKDEFLEQGQIGEIVIQGPNVTRGYANNIEANAKAFTADRWFRTGDQGYLDEEGYLFITGRLKEIINRGGETIAPREIDEALMNHPAIRQAVAFAVPHPTLQEDVAAAVILRSGSETSAKEIRAFAFEQLADYKVPSQILIVDEIPKGATGKLQRIGLADKLEKVLRSEFVPPRTSTEQHIAKIWQAVLKVEPVGIFDNFFAIGGDSLLAGQVVAQINAKFGVDFPLPAIFRHPTVEDQALVIEQGSVAGSNPNSLLVPLRPTGENPPFFCLPGNLGNVHIDLGALATHFPAGHPVYALQDSLENPTQIEAVATRYLAEIQTVQPTGPYLLGGICWGSIVAFEMAQQLQQQRQRVELLALIEPIPPYAPNLSAFLDFTRFLSERIIYRLRTPRTQSKVPAPEIDQTLRRHLRQKVIANRWAVARYAPQPYTGHIDLFLTRETLEGGQRPFDEWTKLAQAGVDLHQIEGTHDTITGNNETPIAEADMQFLAEQLKACLTKNVISLS